MLSYGKQTRMKILFDHPSPFLLAHGGFQIQIEQTKAALESIGVEVEWLRWWDAGQTGELIHFFSVPRVFYLKQAASRRIPVVTTALFSETCNRPRWKLGLQGLVTNLILGMPFGNGNKEQLNWKAYRLCPRLIVGLEAERRVLVKAFGVRPSAITVVPLGLPEAYLKVGPGSRSESYLISPGTITPVKKQVELALLAKTAQVPVLFVGKPYHSNDCYWQRFQSLIDEKYVHYKPHVEEMEQMIGLYQSARGFVLFSEFENWSLVASEAVACGLPLLVPKQNWSKERFGNQARYFDHHRSSKNVSVLQQFYKDCPSLSAPAIKLWSWPEIACQLKDVYEGLANTSR